MHSLIMLIAVLCLSAACTAHDVVLGGSGYVDGAAGHDGGDSMGEATTPRGCGTSNPSGAHRVQLNGGTANYFVDLPAGYDSNKYYPLVLALRASDDTAENFRESLNLVKFAGPTAIVVHADCLNGSRAWSAQRDVSYLDALLSYVLEHYCIDSKRVFMLGYAQGSWMTSEFACQHGDRLRAAALFAGTVPKTSCTGGVAMLVAQGTMDSVYPLASGRNTRDFWVRRNMCQATTTPALPDPCVDYTGCAAETPLRYCEFAGGHELPSFAASGAWAFFETQR